MHYYYAIKNTGHRTRLREKEHLFRCLVSLPGNLLRCVRARAYLHGRAYLRAL